MCIYSPMPHTLSYCALIGKCALIRSNTVFYIKDLKVDLHGNTSCMSHIMQPFSARGLCGNVMLHAQISHATCFGDIYMATCCMTYVSSNNCCRVNSLYTTGHFILNL